MAVRRTDHAELERIGPELLFLLQSQLERAAGILVRQHFRLLGVEAEVPFIPLVVVSKLVIE